MAEMALYMFDVRKGLISPPTTPRLEFNANSTTAIEQVMDMKSADDISSLLCKRIQALHSSLYNVTYLDRASRRLRYSNPQRSVPRFLLASLNQTLSSPTRGKKAPSGSNFPVFFDIDQYFYHSSQYYVACHDWCHSAICKIIAAGFTTSRNILWQSPSFYAPQFSQQLPLKVSLQLLAFLVL